MKKILFCIAITSCFSVYSSNASTMPAQHSTMTGQIPAIPGQIDYQRLGGSSDFSHARVPNSSQDDKKHDEVVLGYAISEIWKRDTSSNGQVLPHLLPHQAPALNQTRAELCQIRALCVQQGRELDLMLKNITDLQRDKRALLAYVEELKRLLAGANTQLSEVKDQLSEASVQSVKANIELLAKNKRIAQLSQDKERADSEHAELVRLRKENYQLRGRNKAVIDQNNQLQARLIAQAIASQQHESSALNAQQELQVKDLEIQTIRSQLAAVEQILRTYQAVETLLNHAD